MTDLERLRILLLTLDASRTIADLEQRSRWDQAAEVRAGMIMELHAALLISDAWMQHNGREWNVCKVCGELLSRPIVRPNLVAA